GITFTSILHTDTYPEIDPKTQSNHRGRAVFINGASRGIGRATAISFAKAGASAIAIGARSNLDGIEEEILAAAQEAGHATPPQVLKLCLDVTDEASISNAALQTEQQFGRLDILVNNSGYLEKWLLLAESNPTEWWRTWEINVRGVHLMLRAFLPLLLKGGQKIVVNVASIGAHLLTPSSSSYSISKLAVVRLTEFVSAEYGAQGIIALAVHPGGVRTELSLNLPEIIHSFLVDAAELPADTITWLASERRDWLSGRYISCNWHMPELVSKKEEIVTGDKLKMKLVL
ncbi:hypothetical protein V8E54_011700, partial [Elaphomyces granulatus]